MRTVRSPRKTLPRAGCIPSYGLVAFDEPEPGVVRVAGIPTPRLHVAGSSLVFLRYLAEIAQIDSQKKR